MENLTRRNAGGQRLEVETYTETPVFIEGLKRTDKGNRHEGRMLNARNPSTMSPTTLQRGMSLRGNDYGWKCA